jgi:hypothetical protein
MSDMSLHGWYPYMNLFEGNVAAQGYADAAWGRSGELNTFFRNRLVKYEARYEAEHGVDYTGYADHTVETIQVDEGSDRQNILGNTLMDTRVVLRGCADTWAEKNLVVGGSSGGPIIDEDDDTSGTVDVDNQAPSGVRPAAATLIGFRASLYLDVPPGYWDRDRKSWPATGSDVDRGGAAFYETLPAQDRYALLPWRPGWGPRVPRLAVAGRADGWPGENLAVRARGYHMDAGIRLRYVVDWGDGIVTASGLVRSGTALVMTHAWNLPGVYAVRCQARDQYGLTSQWSAPVTITVSDLD